MINYFMKTLRIGFSRWKSEDLQLAVRLWGNEKVSQYITSTGKFTEKEIEDRLKLEIKNQDEYKIQYWSIFLLETDEFIGCCGLRPYSSENKIFEIGFHLLPEFWKMRYGSEAANGVINYAIDTLKADSLFAGHNPKNSNSAKLLLHLGFTYTHDEFYKPTGLNHPSYIYRI